MFQWILRLTGAKYFLFYFLNVCCSNANKVGMISCKSCGLEFHGLRRLKMHAIKKHDCLNSWVGCMKTLATEAKKILNRQKQQNFYNKNKEKERSRSRKNYADNPGKQRDRKREEYKNDPQKKRNKVQNEYWQDQEKQTNRKREEYEKDPEKQTKRKREEYEKDPKKQTKRK